MLFIVALLLAIFLFTVGRAAAVNASRAGSRVPPGARAVPLVVGTIFLLIALGQLIRVIPAGHVGVVDLFGKVAPRPLRAGLAVVNPLARVVLMSIKTQEMKEVMDVPSKEGLSVQIEVSALYHLVAEKAPMMYSQVGESYEGIVLEPQFRSVTRGVTASYEAKALYTSEREQLAALIAKDLEILVEPRGLFIEATPLRKLTLPPKLAAAIEEKLGAEQESQRMQFVLQKEQQEAERKRIEAGGIADFQHIVSQGISDQLLRWKGIEATLEISKSANAKVVVIGSGKEGLPIILGAQ